MSAFHASLNGTAATTVSRLSLPAALMLLGACATTPPRLAPIDRPDALRALQAADLRVATIAYRLAVAGEPICPRKTRLTGLTLHDVSQYAPALRDAARDVLGAGERVGVLAVAPNSPAARAGVMAGDFLVSIDGVPLSPSPEAATASYANVAAAQAMLERAAVARVFTLEIERGNVRPGIGLGLHPAPVTGCVSQVQLRTSPDIEAKADGRVLSVSTALLDYVKNDDELALAIAHEMAHNALGHRLLLETRGIRADRAITRADRAEILQVERIADRFGYYLMTRAGFDTGVAPAFWQRLYEGPADSRRDPETHPTLASRVTLARSVATEIADKRARGLPLTP